MDARMKRRQLGAGGNAAAAAAAAVSERAAPSLTHVDDPAGGEVRMSNVSLMSEVEDLKARLASTATQLTTTEDELRQRVELEASLRFAVDVLRTRLDMRKARGGNGKASRRPGEGCPDGGGGAADGEVESVQELLRDLGLMRSASSRAEAVARDAEDLELRIEGLESRLGKSEQARRQAEERLAQREVVVQALQPKIDSLRARLADSERKANAEKSRLEEQLVMSQQSEVKLRKELDHFRDQLALVAESKVPSATKRYDGKGQRSTNATDDGVKPFDEKMAGSWRDGHETPHPITPDGQQIHAYDAEALEARAKAKVLLSLKEEAEISYQGAINDLEAMIAQVYTRELQSELKASRSGGENKDAPSVRPNERALEQLHDMSAQRLDAVSDDFKKLLATRDRMLKLHANIQKQCDAILATADTTDEMERGKWDVSQVHPVLPGAC